MLATIAGLLGAKVAAGGMRRLLVQGADDWPVLSDSRTVLLAVGLTLVTALLAGLLPAIQVGRGDLAGSLKAGTREGAYRSSRARTALLLVQTSLSAILLIGAGLFVRSLREIRAERIGYDVDRIAFAETSMRGLKLDPAAVRSLADRLLERARTTPGVETATFVASIPFYSGEGRGMWVDGVDSVRNLGRFQLQAGTVDYFRTTGTRILRGRSFSTEDQPGAPPIAVISDAMAKAVWPREDAIGKCFRIGKKDSPCITVVGIAENTKAIRITGSDEFMYYLPFPQYVARFGGGYTIAMYVRMRGAADEAVRSLRGPLQSEMPGPSFITVRPLHEIVDPTMQSWNAGARMFLSFGALALVLASIGLYAVMAFAVAQRTQELGVRRALGAQGADLLRLVVGEGVRVTLAGVVLGGAVAYVMGNKLNSLLFGVSGRDPLVYSIVAVTLIVTGVLASVVPASRAARVDPNVALRTD
jgi:predicted permease